MIEPYINSLPASSEGPPSKRTRAAHAGRAAAALLGAASGEFKIDAAERAELKFKCATLKENQYPERRRRTAGGLFMVSACGLFVGVRELYGSESLTQVHLFLHEIFQKHQVPPPDVIAYDDACRACAALECVCTHRSPFCVCFCAHHTCVPAQICSNF